MDKNTVPSTTNPNWWNDKHNSAWDRAREALHRDWEQTKSDFGVGGRDADDVAHYPDVDLQWNAPGARDRYTHKDGTPY